MLHNNYDKKKVVIENTAIALLYTDYRSDSVFKAGDAQKVLSENQEYELACFKAEMEGERYYPEEVTKSEYHDPDTKLLPFFFEEDLYVKL